MRPRAAVLAILLALMLAGTASAEILHFTQASWRAGEDGCSPSAVPLDSVSLIELWRYDSEITLERTRPAGPPGCDETLLVWPGLEQVSYGVRARAPGTRPSCMSNLVTFNGRVDADPAGGPGAGPWLGVPRPNPSGGLVAVSWCLPSAARLRLEVVDIAGRVVARLADSDHAAGVHVSIWDARQAAPGIYLVCARSSGWAATRRVLVLR